MIEMKCSMSIAEDKNLSGSQNQILHPLVGINERILFRSIFYYYVDFVYTLIEFFLA